MSFMYFIEKYMVEVPVDNGGGDSYWSKNFGPFDDYPTAKIFAKGRGLQGRDADVNTLYYLTSDGKTGVVFHEKPKIDTIPSEHALGKVIRKLGPNVIEEVLKALEE